MNKIEIYYEAYEELRIWSLICQKLIFEKNSENTFHGKIREVTGKGNDH